MDLIHLCLKRPVGVSVGVLLVVLFGLLSLYAMPVQLTPTVDVPVIAVQTRWAGANPQEIEQEIVDRQEEMLRSVKGVREMTSTAQDNMANISLEFSPDVDKETALRDVTDKLRQVTGYPLEVDQPTVAAADSSVDNPIAWLILFSDDPSESQETRKLEDFAEDYVKPYLERVPGVAKVDVYGGLKREMQVRVEAGKLAARGLTMNQVVSALRGQNENISAGTRSQGKRDYTVRTVGQYESPDEILDTVVAYTAGGPVYVRDIADVELSYKKPLTFVRSKGQYVLAFPVRRETGTNVMKVMAGVREAIERANREVLRPRHLELELTQVYDETVYITQSIQMVENNIIYGGAFAVIVLMLFLRNWRATLVVALSIPIAVIGTFVVIAGMGRTMNVISLAGMAFAVGMVVDNAIVVLENIFRHREMGKDAFTAAFDGTREVWGAVLASTLTTMAVFIPVIFVSEEAGQLFRDISIATAAAVGLSLIVSVTVIPPLSAKLLGTRRAGKGIVGDESGGRIAGMVADLVYWIDGSTFTRLAVVVVAIGGSLVATVLLVPDATYLPSGNRNLVFGFLLTPPGYSLDEFDRMASTIERTIKPYWEVEPGSAEKQKLDDAWVQQIQARIDAGGIPELVANGKDGLSWLERERIKREWLTPPPAIDNFFFVSFNGGCFMGASSKNSARVKPLTRLLATAGAQIPGIYPIFVQTQLFSFGGGNNAEIQIRGDDIDKVVSSAMAVFMNCMQKYGTPNPNPANFNLGRPELRIVPDRERAADLGLSVVDLGLIVEACVDGAYVGDYRVSGGDTIDISLYIAGQQGRPTQEISQIPIYAPTADGPGEIIPLSSAVRLVDTTSLEKILHVERQRAVTLTVNPTESKPLASVINEIHEDTAAMRKTGAIDPSVLVSLTGNADKLVQARNTMVGEWAGWTFQTFVNIAGSRFFLSVLIVFLLMAALFESWLYPFVIMFSVPLAICGGFIGLNLARIGTLMSTDQPVQQLDVLTFLGFVILVGLVVNNAILLVHQSLHHLRDAGMAPREAIREAVRVRFRPVFMTSLTTFFGQLPLALFAGSGSELYRGLASVMLGGLIVATVGTLVVVPAVLSVVIDLRLRVARAFGGAAEFSTSAESTAL